MQPNNTKEHLGMHHHPNHHEPMIHPSWFRVLYRIVSVVVCLLLTASLLYTVTVLPPFGAADNPTSNEVVAKYIEDGLQDTGATNIVAGMILDYRAFDTFGESCVLFIAVCSVIIILRNEGTRDAYDQLLLEMEDPRHDTIMKTAMILLVPISLIFGIYVVLNGHLSPGGGFSGGAIIGSALIMYASAYGTKKTRTFYSFNTFRNIAFGSLMFYGLAKGYVFFMGANHLPLGIPLGTPGSLFSAGLILPLNICVGLVVSSAMYVLYVLFSKGEML